jgi:hypothetical protein
LVAPVQGEHQVQEMIIPELSHNVFLSLVDISNFDREI